MIAAKSSPFVFDMDGLHQTFHWVKQPLEHSERRLDKAKMEHKSFQRAYLHAEKLLLELRTSASRGVVDAQLESDIHVASLNCNDLAAELQDAARRAREEDALLEINRRNLSVRNGAENLRKAMSTTGERFSGGKGRARCVRKV